MVVFPSNELFRCLFLRLVTYLTLPYLRLSVSFLKKVDCLHFYVFLQSVEPTFTYLL